MSSENPVLGDEESDRDVGSKPVNVTEQAPDRRRIFRRLVTLAGLGIMGVLLSQERTGFLPAVHAASVSYTDTADPVVYAENTSSIGLSRGVYGRSDSTSGVGVEGAGATTTGSNIGVLGASLSSSGIGVEGLANNDGAVPLVAKANSPTQTGHLQEWQNSSGTALSVVDKNGNFGIGTASPATKLYIYSATPWDGIVFQGGTSTSGINGFEMQNSSGYQYNVGITGSANSAFANGVFIYDNKVGAFRFVILPSGYVGIGTQTPTHLIHLHGGAYCNGTGAWIAGSSVRWKENIQPLTDGVDTLKQLHPVSYNRKETPSKKTMGFIAEEVGKVLPTVVDWDKAEPGYAEGYDHLAILALSVQAIKEQQSTLQKQQSIIQEQQKQISEHQSTIQQLEERTAFLEQTVKQLTAS